MASASVASASLRDGRARVGEMVAMQCVVDILLLLLLLWWQLCCCGPAGWACKLACLFVRKLLAASDVWGRVVVRQDCDGGGGGACLFVCLLCCLW